MKEAVETAKLRLFLKLVAQTDDFEHVEPLPDIDFNIRCGNTLVGFATEKELQKGLTWTLDGPTARPLIEESCETVAKAFSLYKQIQLTQNDDYQEFCEAKKELNNRLKILNERLNKLLKLQTSELKFDKWLITYQPFHWFAEFYEIVHDNKGFDIVIGNPPYVGYSEKNFDYKISNYETLECKDLYAYVIERTSKIVNGNGSIGMIVPISIVSTDGFDSLRSILQKSMDGIWFSSYSMRPAKLFEGVEKHITIFISNKLKQKNNYSTRYHRWYSEERENLFSKLMYTKFDHSICHNKSFPKIGSQIEFNILTKIKSNKSISNNILTFSSHVVYHTRKLRYFLQFLDTSPKIFEQDGESRVTSELKEVYFETEEAKFTALSIYLSSLFFWYYAIYSDCRNLNKREVTTFPLSLSTIKAKSMSALSLKGNKIMEDLQKNSFFQDANYKQYGKLKMQVFQPRLSKPIIDDIDTILADHYGFTSEELDFIINYDIKYRMGKELDNGEEEE